MISHIFMSKLSLKKAKMRIRDSFLLKLLDQDPDL
jgi:hypothetical protein